MENKKVKQMICDALNTQKGISKSFRYYWDEQPVLICFTTANFIYSEFGVVSLTAFQLKGK